MVFARGAATTGVMECGTAVIGEPPAGGATETLATGQPVWPWPFDELRIDSNSSTEM